MNKPTLMLLIAALSLVACAPATRIITVPSTRDARPTADSATLLIGNVMNFKVVNILDGNGRVVGQLSGRSHTVVQVPPGHVKLYVVPEKEGQMGDRVEGTVEAGKLYYLSVGMRWGGASFTTISKRLDAEGWNQRKTYETDLPNLQLDSAQLSGLETDLGDTSSITTRVDGVVATFDAEEKKNRTLEGGDGE